MNEAIFGFIGVLVGSFIPWIKDGLEKKKHAKYLAARVICILDEYVDKCVEVVQDDGTVMGQLAGRTKDGEEYPIPQVKVPSAPEYPNDIDWQAIDAQLMYSLLVFPNKVKEQHKHIDFASNEASPGWMDELFVTRGKSHIKLGLEANALAQGLRKAYEMPNRVYEDWNPIEFLESKKRECIKS